MYFTVLQNSSSHLIRSFISDAVHNKISYTQVQCIDNKHPLVTWSSLLLTPSRCHDLCLHRRMEMFAIRVTYHSVIHTPYPCDFLV